MGLSEDWSEHMKEDIKKALELLKKDAILFEYPKWKYDILMEDFI